MDYKIQILNAFREFAGDEKFERFAEALRARPVSALRREEPGLLFWQQDLWQDFCRSSEKTVPEDYGSITDIFSLLPEPVRPRLSENEIPEWCSMDRLDGQCPVQGWGTVMGHAWYFRARHGHWSLELSKVAGEQVDEGNMSAHRLIEEPYEGSYSGHEAGYMELDEARFYIVSRLRRLAAEAGFDISEE